MKNFNFIWRALINAAGVCVYTAAVSWLLFNANVLFDQMPDILGPLLMLLLLVISASVTGLLVFGVPFQLYLDNQKKEAVRLLITTIAWLIIFFVLAVCAILLVKIF